MKLDVLGKEIKVGDRIAIARANWTNEAILEIGEVISVVKDQCIVVTFNGYDRSLFPSYNTELNTVIL
jgi:hypothetical protein